MRPILPDQLLVNAQFRVRTDILDHLLFLEVDNGTEPGKEPIR